jgi:ribosomal subunit interface protein
MKIIVKGLHLSVTEEMQDYVEKRLKGVEKFLDEASLIEVELAHAPNHQHTGDTFRTEMNVNVHGELIHVKAEAGDLHSTVDEARAELFETLSSRKDKRQTLWKKGKMQIKSIMKGVSKE